MNVETVSEKILVYLNEDARKSGYFSGHCDENTIL